MGIYDYIILSVITILGISAILFIKRQRRLGKNCSSGCGGCPYVKNCNPKKTLSR